MMRHFIVILGIIGFAFPYGLCGYNSAQAVSLHWDASTDDSVAGYKLLISTTSGGPYSEQDAGLETSCVPSGLAVGGTYYAVTVAYYSNGQWSPPSNEVQFVVTPQNFASILPITVSGSSRSFTPRCNLESFRVWKATTLLPVPNWTLLATLKNSAGFGPVTDSFMSSAFYRITN